MQEQYGEAAITGLHGAWDVTGGGNINPTNRPKVGAIVAGGSYTVMHKLGLSVMSSGKLVPTRYMPLELELQLGATVSDYLVAGANLSSNFTLQNIQLIYDVYEADPAVSESFFRSLLSNQVYPSRR